MSPEKFNNLTENQKAELIFDANKISEKVDNEANYQLFQIGNFFVEAKTSVEGKFKRFFTTYTLKDLPVEYAGEVLALPIVILDDQPQAYNVKKSNNKKGAFSRN